MAESKVATRPNAIDTMAKIDATMEAFRSNHTLDALLVLVIETQKMADITGHPDDLAVARRADKHEMIETLQRALLSTVVMY